LDEGFHCVEVLFFDCDTKGLVALRRASEELRNDKDIVLAAVKVEGFALQFASETLRNDKDVVLAAVKEHPDAFQFASETLRNNKGVVIAAVKQNGFVLQFASETLRNDKDVVLAAVKEHGFALQFASEALRNDIFFIHKLVIEGCHNGLFLFTDWANRAMLSRALQKEEETAMKEFHPLSERMKREFQDYEQEYNNNKNK
jgi:predicted methyltransferase